MKERDVGLNVEDVEVGVIRRFYWVNVNILKETEN